MTSPLVRSATVFAIAFTVAYVVAEQVNLPLFTYHPRIGQWGWLYEASRTGPAMHWFGWNATALLVAALAVGAGRIVPQRVGVPVWLGWAVPVAAIALFFWLMRKFFGFA